MSLSLSLFLYIYIYGIWIGTVPALLSGDTPDTEWFKFNSNTSKADFDTTIANELYSHKNDDGSDMDQSEQVYKYIYSIYIYIRRRINVHTYTCVCHVYPYMILFIVCMFVLFFVYASMYVCIIKAVTRPRLEPQKTKKPNQRPLALRINSALPS